MSAFFHAVEVFFDHLTAVHFGALGIAIALHVLKIVARALAWRNVLRAAFPDSRVKHRVVFGAYFAGVGLNSIAPARTGDALKVYLAKRGIEGSNYATLASSLFVETLFDILVASTLLIWALQLGVLPSLDVLPSIPDVEWGWAVRNPRLAILIGTVLFFIAVVVAFSAADRIKEFRHRLANGFAILGNWRRYLTEVVSWQALSWGFRFAAVWWFLKAFDIPRDTAQHGPRTGGAEPVDAASDLAGRRGHPARANGLCPARQGRVDDGTPQLQRRDEHRDDRDQRGHRRPGGAADAAHVALAAAHASPRAGPGDLERRAAAALGRLSAACSSSSATLRRIVTSVGLMPLEIVSFVITHLETSLRDGSSNITSSSAPSMIERKPRAPVSRSSAWSEISHSASSVNTSSISS